MYLCESASLAVLILLWLQLIHLHPLHLAMQIIASDGTNCPKASIPVYFVGLKALTPRCSRRVLNTAL